MYIFVKFYLKMSSENHFFVYMNLYQHIVKIYSLLIYKLIFKQKT